MDSVLNRLASCVQCLDANKISGRKKGIDTLRELLDQDEVVETLNKISVNTGELSVSWDRLFTACHRALLMEADRQVKTETEGKALSTAFQNSKILYSSIVSKIAKKANADTPHISCNTIIDAVIYVMDKGTYRNVIGDTYVTILLERILPISKYWGVMKLENWISLYEIGIKLFKKPVKNAKVSSSIAIIELTVKYGCEHSSLITVIKKRIFPLLKDIVDKAVTDTVDFQYHVVKLLVTVGEKLRKECRMAMCKFGEEIFDKTLDMRLAKSMGATGKTDILVDFLLMIVECHHPGGAQEDSAKAYAHNWVEWKKILIKVSHYASKEIENAVHKYTKTKSLPDTYLKLIIEVHNQIMRCDCNFVEVTMNLSLNHSISSLERGGTKRRRIACGFVDFIDCLKTASKPIAMWPWLSVISSLVTSYPSLVNENGYLLLLQNMYQFLSASKEPVITDYLCECCIALIDCRHKSCVLGTDLPEEEVIWNSIWNSVLRTIGLNQNVEWSHKLLRHMMKFMWKSTMTNSILKLYLSHVVRLSKHSLLTLYHLRLRVSFPNMILDVPVCSALLRWMLPVIPEYMEEYYVFDLPSELHAHMMVLTCLRNNVQKSVEGAMVLQFDVNPQPVFSAAEIHALTSYDSTVFLASTKAEKLRASDCDNKGCVVNDDAFEQLLNLIDDHGYSLLEMCRTATDKFLTVQYLSSYAVFLLQTLKFEEHYEANADIVKIGNELQRILEELFSITERMLSSEKDYSTLITVLGYLSSFFQQCGTIPSHLADFIFTTFFPQLKVVFDFLEETNNDTEKQDEDEPDCSAGGGNSSLFDPQTLSEYDTLRVEACKLLIFFSFSHDSIHPKQYQIVERVLEVQCELLEAESCPALLQTSVFSVQAALKLKDVDLNLFSKCISTIQSICTMGEGEWCRTEESAVVILSLIQHAIRIAHLFGEDSEWKKLSVLVKGMRVICEDGGARTTVEIVRCLGLFVETNDLATVSADLMESLLLDIVDIFDYLSHPIHEVRVTAISFIPGILTLLDQFASTEQFDCEPIINRFNDALLELFLVDGLTEEEIDENINRPLTVLYSLSGAICCSKTSRRRFIFLLFYLTYEKRLERALVRKIMELVKEHLKLQCVNDLIKDNLVYVLCSWYKKYKTFEIFPFEVTRCETIEGFYEKYQKEIVVVLLFYGDTAKLNEIAPILGTHLPDLFKHCFPEIMAIVLKKITEEYVGSQSADDIITPSHPSDEEMNTADMHDLVVDTVGRHNFDKMMVSQLSEVLISILRNLHDPYFEIPANSILPIPTPFVSNENLVRKTIIHFQAQAGTDMPLFVYIAKTWSKYIQKIFLNLYVDVMKASTPEMKLESLQKYILFCELLLPHYEELVACQMPAFVTRTLVNNLLNFISSDEMDAAFATTTLKFFLKFLSQWLSPGGRRTEAVSVIEQCLSHIVQKMVLLGGRDDAVGDTALRILRYLIHDQQDCLLDSIATLDQFPDQPQFEQFRNACLEVQETQVDGMTLLVDMKLFLNSCDHSPFSPCRLESLKHLRKQLLSNKSELISIYQDCAAETLFSEDCVKSIPHRIVCALIQLTKADDENVRYEAVCCLSEIGLVDLNTLVLQPNCSVHDCLTAPELLVTKSVICEVLKDAIIDSDVEVANAASRVLYKTLFSREGYSVVRDKLSELEKLLIFPFIPSDTASVVDLNLWAQFSVDKFKEHVNNEILWLPIEKISYDKWIVNIVCGICNSFGGECFLNAVQSLCRLKVAVAEKMFNYLVLLLHSCRSTEPLQILGDRINQFLQAYFTSDAIEHQSDSYSSSRSSGKNSNGNIYSEKSSVLCLLNVVNYVRLNRVQPAPNDMNLNFFYVAKAASHCGAYFTSILYAELYVNSLILRTSAVVSYDGNILSFLEQVGNKCSEDQNDLLNILRDAFSKIGDSDALDGCASSVLLHPETRILHYQQIDNWNRVFESCDTRLACEPSSNSKISDFTTAIGRSGFGYLQHQYLSSLEQLTLPLKDALYESAWKLSKWDLVEPCDDEKTFSYYQYAALKDVHLRNYDGARINVKNARHCLIPSLARIGLESTKNVYHIQTKLQCLQDIENFSYATDVSDVIDGWKRQDGASARLNFKHKEAILNQRVRMINASVEEARNFIVNTARQARKERNFSFAEACLSLVKDRIVEPLTLFDLRVCFEEARILWDRKETYVARYLLKDLLRKEAAVAVHTFHATLLRTYGQWLSETNLENADTIFDDYFLPSSELMPKYDAETAKERKTRLKTYKQVAEFADLQYQQICEYIKSDAFEEQIKSVSESRKQSEALSSLTSEMRRSKIQLANQSKIEDSQVKEIQSKEKRYLNLAMRYYLKVLAESEEEDLKIFRVVSFWLHQKTNVEVHKELRESLFDIPSYKFVPVLPQLMAHITRGVDCFSHLLGLLIEKCAVEHPHHTLPLMFSLANYTKDEEIETPTNRSKSNDERVNAASEFIKKLRINAAIGTIVTEMEALCEAYIELAYYKPNIKANSVASIPSSLRITRIKNLENIPCLTVTLPVNKQQKYHHIVGIHYIDSKFTGLCGVNAPKKITCICTDGRKRNQLVKGQDDMRVDAVMQQIFTIMNKLLVENKHTSKRKLLLRTYKVVPLSQRSGVLEWCTNTMCLGEYLAASNTAPGAHKRFRPSDMSTAEARKRLTEVRQRNDEVKLQTYEKICKHLKPVFRYFFIEKFPLPTMWFERKLAYIHSVATTSMVGYIIGLGDRHVQNMLIDEKTAEIIHIDFGVAFDQGLTLNCPERIPFRLTRDIEDGMGICSIDGIFRRCCEQVMAVLRDNSEIIRTTSEVFIHDPLYIWTLTPEKRASVQSTGSKHQDASNQTSQINITASRALSRLKLKLQGLEEGTPTSIEGQVNRLIQQAKDPRNLSRLFQGWQPYL